ncbi:MAG: hypothetical protein IT537_12215 [Hyphomicrobiales bacterium]|nr:hypothetical protein [Hyphomicrobiales bacterium]
MAHCSKVNPRGSAAVACLQRNASSLSPKCRAVVAEIGGGATPPAGMPAGGPPPGGLPPGAAPPGAPPALPSAATPTQEVDIASVETVKGRVLAFARGKPSLLGDADVITTQTQLDLQDNSDLRICHFNGNRLFILRGPTRATVSADGVADASGRTLTPAGGSCTPPGR